jgi:hypothetical protein
LSRRRGDAAAEEISDTEGDVMAQNKQTLFVIFSGPKQHAGPGTHYFAEDGSTTTLRPKAARFYTFTDQNQITLSAHIYIGREEFTEFDLRG